MLVSIVTPSFNQAQYLEQTMASVLTQSYPNIEYIVMDGGSKDGSVEIIKKYAPYLIFWDSKKDKGQSDAINQGWSRAVGDIWCYLNSDDLLFDNNTIEKVVKIFKENPEAVMVYGHCLIIDEAGNDKGLLKAKKATPIELLQNNFGESMSQPACFFKADAIKKCGFLDINYHFAMDFEFIVRLGQEGSFVFEDAIFAKYRVHKSAKSFTYALQQMQEGLQIRWIYGKKFFLKHWFRYQKLQIFLLLPTFLQKKMNYKLYEKLNID
jgi:glycosyltransferase involved in cell wall biosynthesis